MPRISSVIPFPGVNELENMGKRFIRLLKDGVENNEGAEFVELLESTIKSTENIDQLVDFNKKLRLIQTELEVADRSRSQQRRLEKRSDLKNRFAQTTMTTMVGLLAQMLNAQADQAVARWRELKVIETYRITDEVDVCTRTWPDSKYQSWYPPGFKPAQITLRSGRLENVSVAYLTFVSDSENTAHEWVEKEVKSIFQLQHLNVAKFVGVTHGYNGLNGFVVAIDGIDFYDFVSRTHSGAVWAKCIRSFEAFNESAPRWTQAERITVSRDGHVTIFPGSLGSMYTSFQALQHDSNRPKADPAVELLMRMYMENYVLLGPTGLRPFVDALAELGLAYTELQLMNIAALCGIFPPHSRHLFAPSGYLSSPWPEVGEFGRATYCQSMLVGWESLGTSRHVQREGPEGQSWGSKLNTSKSPKPNGDHWVSYALGELVPYSRTGDHRIGLYHEGSKSFCQSDWEDIFTEAKEISQSVDIDIDSIECCFGVWVSADLTRPEGASWDDIPTTLYYHCNHHSSDPREAGGFLGANKIPDAGVWHESLKERGWELDFWGRMETYNMRDDWGRQYERALKSSMAVMPGNYPGAQIEGIEE